MKIFPVVVALFALLGLMPLTHANSPRKPPVIFVHTPIEPGGLRFELVLPAGNTRFQQGETIPIRLLFSNRGTQTLCLDTFYFSPPSLATFASFTVQTTKATINPLGDLPDQMGFSYDGPGPPRPQVLGEKPFEVTLVLNEYLRFDHAGNFQIRATTNHVFAVPKGQSVPSEGEFFGSGTPVTSSPLSIEIVPANANWQQEQVEGWRAFWAKQKLEEDGFGWSAPTGVQPPANDLRFLNTRAAAQAMIDRLGQDIAPRSSGSEAYFWRSGLVGFSDREWLVGAMKDAMKRPDYPVTQGFLENLATLQALYHVARAGQKTRSDQFAKVEERASFANWKLAYDSLAPKQGRARAMTVHTLLETAWLSNLSNAPEVQKHLPHLIAMVPDIFNDLPDLPQQYLLDDSDDKYAPVEWKLVKSPRFVAPLLRTWKTVPHSEGWGLERGDLILRHLYELDPKVARLLILKEMAAPHPRVSFKVLSLLPDKYLPQLENIWWRNLTSNGPDQDMAALLIGRYATPALKAKVQTEYAQRKRDHMLSFDVSRGLKQYLARVGS